MAEDCLCPHNEHEWRFNVIFRTNSRNLIYDLSILNSTFIISSQFDIHGGLGNSCEAAFNEELNVYEEHANLHVPVKEFKSVYKLQEQEKKKVKSVSASLEWKMRVVWESRRRWYRRCVWNGDGSAHWAHLENGPFNAWRHDVSERVWFGWIQACQCLSCQVWSSKTFCQTVLTLADLSAKRTLRLLRKGVHFVKDSCCGQAFFFGHRSKHTCSNARGLSFCVHVSLCVHTTERDNLPTKDTQKVSLSTDCYNVLMSLWHVQTFMVETEFE